ncbi:DUF397 domain-containing protein [Hamadaea sp. NPDC050747]|uniref:DUF397 domain-containing protein n=1 Tax=Hamadaea sp. NPDC050747 TaxID=3155789 RepID=UPI0033CAE822
MSRRETEPTQWRRSSRCEAATCAEVSFEGSDVLIRSSLAPETVVRLTGEEWQAFRDGVVAGDFDERS